MGSFLHALHLPFAGALLASVGAALLLAQRQIFDVRGITLATGLVAACCKSLSPGGVILGPMLGITVEAALVEAVLLLGAARLPAAMMAGMLAALWALSQKVLVQVLLYGGDIIALWIAAVSKASSWIGISETAGWSVLGAVAGLLALVGASAALTGRGAGQRVRRLLVSGGTPE